MKPVLALLFAPIFALVVLASVAAAALIFALLVTIDLTGHYLADFGWRIGRPLIRFGSRGCQRLMND